MRYANSPIQTSFSIKVGLAYHIKDEYFELVQNCDIKRNFGGRTYPACCCLNDEEKSIYWMIPMSTKIEKYKRIHDRELDKYGNVMSVVIGEYDGREVAFQIQNMFPIVKKYILHPHTRNGKTIPVEKSLLSEIQRKFCDLRRLNGKGIACTLTDIRLLEKLVTE